MDRVERQGPDLDTTFPRLTVNLQYRHPQLFLSALLTSFLQVLIEAAQGSLDSQQLLCQEHWLGSLHELPVLGLKAVVSLNYLGCPFCRFLWKPPGRAWTPRAASSTSAQGGRGWSGSSMPLSRCPLLARRRQMCRHLLKGAGAHSRGRQ